MGVVYHAIDPNIGRPLAIKTIRLADARKPEEQERLRERLQREARSAGMLSHPGIVTIYDVEQHGDVAYIAMEYVDGPTLEQLMARDQPMAPDQIFSVLGQTAAALDYAHQKGIVHRDIKPANIMIAADGTAKITDFGIAKISASDQFTVTGTIVGTPHYMSPEQVQGQAIDGHSDQFSLAVIAYEILTGEKPYTGEHLTTVVYKIVAEEPVSPHRLNPTLAGAIQNVLRKGLAKKPEGRYRTCQEFAQSLEQACAATRGWKPMARGSSLQAKTATAPAVTLPPARNPRREDTIESASKQKSGFLTFLLAIIIITGVLSVAGRMARPWLNQSQATPVVSQTKAAEPVPVTPPQQVAADVEKPSPMPPAEPVSESAEPVPPVQAPAQERAPVTKVPAAVVRETRRPPALPAVAPARHERAPQPQEIQVVSSPAGATATLDARPDASCATPCSLSALPGRHSVSVTMPGYQVERREVEIGMGPVELPAVVLRAPGGTLMLASVPSGALISVNGRRLAQVTPAQIPLAPGTYNITLEKNGRQATQQVEVQNGRLNYLKVPLE